MSRLGLSRSGPSNHQYLPTCASPPWEQRSIPQVPYLPPSDPSLSSEKQVSPWMFSARSVEAGGIPSRKSSTTSDSVVSSSTASPPITRSSSSPPSRSSQTMAHAAPAVPASTGSSTSSSRTSKQRSRSTSGAASGQVDSVGRAQRRQGTDQWCDSKRIASSVPLRHRFKTALKDIFKKDPIDQSKFEDIDNKHWTEL